MDITLEPDPAPRKSQWHKRIVGTRPIPNTRTGHYLRLECGHWVQTFGDLDLLQGRVLCTECREAAGKG